MLSNIGATLIAYPISALATDLLARIVGEIMRREMPSGKPLALVAKACAGAPS